MRALRRVADAGTRRAELLAEADRIAEDEIRAHAIEAVRLGAGRTRVRELARVGPGVLYRWLEEAGIPVRTKAEPKAKRRRRDAP